MAGSRRGVLGVAVLLLIAVALTSGAVRIFGVEDGGGDQMVVVRGTVGSEKAGLLANPRVREILADRYAIRVEFASAGSLEMRESGPANQDFLWPASQIADEWRYEPAPRSEEIFYSPIVLYSWGAVTDVLAAAGLVQQIDGVYYVTDFPRLVELIDAGIEWSELGLTQPRGPIAITTTDPTTSNSGSSFAGLLAITYNGGQVVDATMADGVLDQVQAYFARLGPLEESTGDLFNQYVTRGMGAYPIIAGYESSLIEFSLEHAGDLDPVRDDIRLLYPRPTVWSSHPVIALTARGERLLTALQDEEIERLAWERHGFRSSLFGDQDDPTVLEVVGVPATTSPVMPLPRAAVMERIVEALRPQMPGTPQTPGVVGSTHAGCDCTAFARRWVGAERAGERDRRRIDA